MWYNNLMKKAIIVLALLLGIVFLILTFVYWTTPASGLPTYLPGYNPAMATPHFKHGLLALILAVLSFIYAWFATGKKH